MADRHSDVERRFRGALLRVCNEMGEETWKSFCFLYDIPERVREGSRSDALDYLLKTGELSSERPAEFIKQLRLNLGHTDLAEKFTGEIRSFSFPHATVCVYVIYTRFLTTY